MNSLSRHRKTFGFTLIELLTVIAIIAVLMGLLFPAVGAVRDSARKAQAKNDLIQVVNALKAYYTEYGRYPVGSQTGSDNNDYRTDQDQDRKDIFDVLRVPFAGTTPPLNPRRIVFIEIPAAKDQNNPRAGLANGIFYDPWGKPYTIRVDNNYNGLIENPYTGNTGAGYGVLNTGVIAWSDGKDKKGPQTGGAKNFKESDDVISWQ